MPIKPPQFMFRHCWRTLVAFLFSMVSASTYVQGANVQQTNAIFALNGVLTPLRDARSNAQLLQNLVTPSLSAEELAATQFSYIYNDTQAFNDVLETFLQSAGLDLVRFWRALAGLEPFPDYVQNFFNDLATQTVFNANALDQSTLSRVVDTSRLAMRAGKRVVVVAHSQGNLYSNSAALLLTPVEKQSWATVNVAVPDESIEGSLTGYTTLALDGIIHPLDDIARSLLFLPAALPPNISDGYINPFARTLNHNFTAAYLGAEPSRSQIVQNTVQTMRSLVIPPVQATIINSVADLQNIENNLSGNYVLGGDIDASGFNFTAIGISAPLTGFTGTLDGLGHTITNLTISDPGNSQVGLFREVGQGSTVRNLNIANASVNVGPGSDGGLLAGYTRYASIDSVSVSGSLIGNGARVLGGLVGLQSGGIISNASASVTVRDSVGRDPNGYGYYGGLVGVGAGDVVSSHADGMVSGGYGSQLGGLVGNVNFSNSVTNSYSTATVTGGDNSIAGGLVGLSGGGIVASYATGAVSVGNDSQVGGLAGMLICTCAAPYDKGTVSSSYAMGSVTGGDGSLVGGIVGWNIGGWISSSYETGAVAGGTGSLVGGIDGRNEYFQNSIYGAVVDSYWNSSTSGTVRGTGSALILPGFDAGTGLTTAQLQSGSLPSGFDPAVWTAAPGRYPRLIWQGP